MRKQLFLLIISLLAAPTGFAQIPYDGEVRVAFPAAELEERQVTLRATVDPSALEPGRNGMVWFTPALRSLDGSREISFDKVAVTGTRRAKALRRNDYFDGTQLLLPENFYVRSRKSIPEAITLEYRVPFEKWMRRSEFVVVEQTSGCCNDALPYADGTDRRIHSAGPGNYPPPYEPAFTISYQTPEADPVKIVEETYTAALNFPGGRSDLLHDYKNNARVLSGIGDIIGRIRSDSLLTIRSIVVRGYASPEGSETGNRRLSQARAQAIVTYLHWKHGFYEADRIITAEGMGEDWAGLRRMVEASRLEEKGRILAAIDDNADPVRRKAAIKAIAGGKTYRMLLEGYFPQLRRNEYTICYEVRGFSPQQAAALIGTRPQLLSLNEMFLVSQLYPHSSQEFKNVFDVAARMYPDSEVAQFNAAAVEIENGAYDAAIRRLEKSDTPQAWNNTAIAFWHKGDYEKAFAYLRKAADGGLETAKDNLAQYHKWFEDRDEEQ